MIINLASVIGQSYALGSALGKQILPELTERIDRNMDRALVAINLAGIERLDCSFAMHSLVQLVKLYREESVIYVTHADQDVLDNISGACYIRDERMRGYGPKGIELLGQPLPALPLATLEVVTPMARCTTVQVAEALGITVSNASTRLKVLFKLGLINREAKNALTGGNEFIWISPTIKEVE